LIVNARLPTGSRENLRGLGVTRTLVSMVASGGRGRFRPYGGAGFEFWSKGIDVAGAGERVSVRHQFQYSGGIELEAAPKLTLVVDFLGQRSSAAGRSGLPRPLSASLPASPLRIPVALPAGHQQALLARA
jgi:hypothetical protein